MRYIIIILTPLLLFVQKDRVDASFLVGKWRGCSDITIGFEQYEIDSNKVCQNDSWSFEFFADGTYIPNENYYCDKDPNQNKGRWILQGQQLKRYKRRDKCGHSSSRTYDKIIKLNENLWYTKGLEGRAAKPEEQIYVHMYFERIK